MDKNEDEGKVIHIMFVGRRIGMSSLAALDSIFHDVKSNLVQFVSALNNAHDINTEPLNKDVPGLHHKPHSQIGTPDFRPPKGKGGKVQRW